MDFLKLIQSLDELLYEIMSWLIFYPITLWRMLTRPLQMMDYSELELGDDAEDQYQDTLTPPLFLLLTLILVHVIALSTVGDSDLVKSRIGLAALVSDDTSLIMLRVATFGIFPLIFAARLVRAKGEAIDRDTLRAPFYSQCYVAGLLAMLTGFAGVIARLPHDWGLLSGFAFYILALLWFGVLQSMWFAEHLKRGRLRAFGQASRAMVESLAAVGLVGLLFI